MLSYCGHLPKCSLEKLAECFVQLRGELSALLSGNNEQAALPKNKYQEGLIALLDNISDEVNKDAAAGLLLKKWTVDQALEYYERAKTRVPKK